ncbi:hypothetical protein K8R14_01585, partial [bacterium]|nr:hypothetical protein [bacterium]
MKNYTNKIICKRILSAIVLIACIPIVSATPPIPESYWGYATFNGVPAPDGTSITVEVYGTGEVVGNTTVQYPNGGYSLDIIFNDTDTAEDEGANREDALTWKINEINCSVPAPGIDTATSGGTNSNFNLTATDTTAPVIHSVTLDPTNPNTGDDITVTVNVTDDIGVTDVTANGEFLSYTGVDDTWEGNITAIDGTHTVNISASDAAANTVYDETANYTATTPADTTAPVIHSVTLDPADPNTGDDITVTVNVTDDVEVTDVTANGEFLSYTGVDDTWEGNITAIDGTHTVNISASDAAANTVYDETANYTATTPADTTAPVIHSVTLDP